MAFRRVAIAQVASIFREYEVCDFGHLADGGVHFNLVLRAGNDHDPARVAALRHHILELAVRDFGASFSGEHGIGRANQGAYDHYIPAVTQHYSAAIAALFARLPAAAVRFGPAVSLGED
jgi:FAD/FMN-containing dehydrogenase